MKKNNKKKNHVSKKDAKDVLNHLEDQYRKANVSEKDYKALKEKYSSRLNGVKNMSKKDKGKKEEEIEEITPEVIERLATQLSQQSETTETEEKTEKEKKGGFFSKLFGGKKKDGQENPEQSKGKEKTKEAEPEQTTEEPVSETQEQADEEENRLNTSEISKKIVNLEVELEKLKTIMETVRETGHVTDETIQAISESIGELRSLIFQTDASLKETMVKMEKIEDDVGEVQPKEIAKKFREIDATFEKHNLEIEKMQTKIEDSSNKLNKMYEMLKSIGGIENLVDINKKIQEKLKDVEEAVKYIGRIGAKTEKQFMDLSRGLEDLVLFKAKEEDLDESLKEIIKSIDALNVKFEGYVSKKDLDVFREDIMVLKKQIENVSKVLPLIDVKLPEEIIDLRREREDILLLLGSLEEQYETKKITKAEYMSFKEGNEKRLKEIEKQLEKEWKKVEKLMKPSEKGTPEQTIGESPTPMVEEQPRQEETKTEEVKAEIEKSKEVEETKSKMEEVNKVFGKDKEEKIFKEDEKAETEKEEVQEQPVEQPEEKKEIKTEKKVEEIKPKKVEEPKKDKGKKMKKIAKKSKKIAKVVKKSGDENKRMKILSDIKKLKT